MTPGAGAAAVSHPLLRKPLLAPAPLRQQSPGQNPAWREARGRWCGGSSGSRTVAGHTALSVPRCVRAMRVAVSAVSS